MISTHESGSQEDQFDEKKGGKKSRETIPLNKFTTTKMRYDENEQSLHHAALMQANTVTANIRM
jgi:hypothetical protein